MEKPPVGLVLILIFMAYLLPVWLDAHSYARDAALNESEQLDYYNSLNAADKANYTSIYAEDGEPPTPWSTAEKLIFGVIGLIGMMFFMGLVARARE